MDKLLTPTKFTLSIIALLPLLGGWVVVAACATKQPDDAKQAQPLATPAKQDLPKPSPATPKTQAQVKAELTVIRMALDAFASNNAGVYPDDMRKLVLPDMNGHRYLNQTTVPKDPWGREYCYVVGPPPNVSTFGADGVPGGTGDDADIDYASLPRD